MVEFIRAERIFEVGQGLSPLEITEVGSLRLDDNEQIVLQFGSSNYDVVKKNWGFYATPSINRRLRNEGFKTALVRNRNSDIYVMIVHQDALGDFEDYCYVHQQELLFWIDEKYSDR